MDSDQGKLFIGGISWETTEDTLRDYFKRYGEVVDSVIMRDRNTGTARGFGFVVFADPNIADRVLLEKHTIAGRAVEVKKAVPRNEQQQGGSGPRVFNRNGSPQGLAGGHMRTKKIFVGGLPATLSEDDFRQYFEQFGNITDVVVMYDNGTQRPRGFGFITFDSEDAVENVLKKSFHELHDKLVEVKRAVPKEANMGGSRGRGFGGAAGAYGSSPGYGGAAGAYGSSPGAAGRYGGAPPPSAGRGVGGYAGGYGPTGYVAAPGGYAPGVPGGYMNGGYGGGAGYGSPGGGYGMGGYGGVPAPPLGGGYGGGPAPPQVAGYGNAPAPAPQSPWGGATASVGGVGMNSAGYGPKAIVGAGSGGQSPGGVPGYGNAPAGAYPYGDGGYNSGASGGYGAGYGVPAAPYKMGMGGGYGDSHGAPGGYPDAAWKTGGGVDISGGASAGGYGVGGGSQHADGTMNDPSGYGGGSYGAAGRQGQRGPDGRFRPYPERTG